MVFLEVVSVVLEVVLVVLERSWELLGTLWGLSRWSGRTCESSCELRGMTWGFLEGNPSMEKADSSNKEAKTTKQKH